MGLSTFIFFFFFFFSFFFSATILSGPYLWFIPAVTRLWNDLPPHVIESVAASEFESVPLIHIFLVDSFSVSLFLSILFVFVVNSFS